MMNERAPWFVAATFIVASVLVAGLVFLSKGRQTQPVITSPTSNGGQIHATPAAELRADDIKAEMSLREALVAALALHVDANDFSKANPVGMSKVEPSLRYVDAGTSSTGPRVVSVYNSADAAGGQIWVAAALSVSGTCFVIANNATGSGTNYYGAVRPSTDCTA